MNKSNEQESAEETKQFDIMDILSIITNRCLSTRHMEGFYDILNFMTSDNQLPRASEECKYYLLEQFPWLDSGKMQFALNELILMLDIPNGKEKPNKLIFDWLSKLTSGKYGIKCEERLAVKPIPKGFLEKREIQKLRTRIQGALKVAMEYSGTDAVQHKAWVIDQMVRELTGCLALSKEDTDVSVERYTHPVLAESKEYLEFVRKACDGENGPNTYNWDTGIAP